MIPFRLLLEDLPNVNSTSFARQKYDIGWPIRKRTNVEKSKRVIAKNSNGDDEVFVKQLGIK